MNQTIKNMDSIVIKIVEIADNKFRSVEHESTQQIKTLINTYGTLLSDIRRLDNNEYDELNSEKELYEQGEKLKSVVKTLDEKSIPKKLLSADYKAVDNLTTTSSKIKSVLRDIKWMTTKYVAELKVKEFKELTNVKLNEIDNEDDATKKALHKKLNNLYSERDVVNATYGDKAIHMIQYNDLRNKIKVLEEIIKELS